MTVPVKSSSKELKTMTQTTRSLLNEVNRAEEILFAAMRRAQATYVESVKAATARVTGSGETMPSEASAGMNASGNDHDHHPSTGT